MVIGAEPDLSRALNRTGVGPVGQIREIRWSWESKDSDTRVGYASIDGRISIADLISNMQEVAPGIGLDEIQVNFATVKWVRQATANELSEREEWSERQRVRQERWERETLQRLTEKYTTWSPC